MKNSSTIGCLWIALVSIAVMGCVGTPDEDIASAQEDIAVDNGLTANGLTANGLTANGLTANGLTANGLTANGLTANGLTANGLVAGALTDPLAREFLKYVVSCALTADQSVSFTADGNSYTYPGQLGLAPEWGEAGGQCDATCQGWVSGCVISRVDYLGVEREISVRGANPALATAPTELQGYPVYEATYFGNVFASPQQVYGCMLPAQHKDLRVCGSTTAGCVVTFPGTCDVLCDPVLSPDFAFPNCRAEPGGAPYVGSVTVHLPLSND